MKRKKEVCIDPCLDRVENDIGWLKKWIDGEYKENHKELALKIDRAIDQVKITNGSVANIKEEQIVMKTTIKNISIIVVPTFLYIVYKIIDYLIANART